MSETNNSLAKANEFFTFAPQPVRIDPDTGKPYEPSGQSSGWIGFRGSKTGNTAGSTFGAELAAAGVAVGDAYLVVDGSVLPREKGVPFEVHLLKLDRFYTRNKPGTNEMVDAVLLGGETPEMRDKGFREHLYCIFAVKLANGGYRAATGKFRTGQARAFNYIQSAVEKIVKDQGARASFASLSPAHKRALDAAIPGGILLARLWATEEAGDGGDFVLSHEKHRPNPDPDGFNRWYVEAIKPGGDLRSAARFHEDNVGAVRDLIAAKGKKAEPAKK